MDYVRFDEIKKLVPLKMVIDHYGWQLRNAGPNVLRGKCMLPMHGSDKSKESFIATLDKGIGGAWGCHSTSCAAARGGKRGGNVLDLVAAIEGCSIRDAAIKLQTIFLVPIAGESRAPARPEPAPETSRVHGPQEKPVSEKAETGEGSVENKPLTFVLRSIDQKHPYLAGRGLTEETIQEFGIGYFSGKGSM